MVDAGFTPYSYQNTGVVPYGPEIVVSEHVLKDSDQRLFPASKNRSARIRKKLIKRYGMEFRKVPCIWLMTDKIIMHPALYAELQRTMAASVGKVVEAAVLEDRNDG